MEISIALCTYNGEKFLGEQLDSILGQSLLPDELVICDDGSVDSTLEILEAFRSRAAFPVRIHRNGANLGSTKNFEQAISLCSGEVIALCDQDDVWKPHKLERLAATLEEHPAAGYAFSDAELVDENLQPLGRRLWESVRFSGDIKELFLQGAQFRCLIRQHVVTGATMAFRAPVGRLAMPFPEQGTLIHDGWIALVGSATGALGVPVEEPLVAYRQHTNQQIGAPEETEEADQQSLLDMFRELKKNHRYLFDTWESRCLEMLRLRDLLISLKERHSSSALDANLRYLRAFEIHYLNRKKILTSSDPGRYGLIVREAFTGRYARFSDSWRSLFRDLFL